MSLWFSDYNLDQINQQNKNTMVPREYGFNGQYSYSSLI